MLVLLVLCGVAQVEAQAVAEVVAGTGVVGGTPFGGDSVSVTRNSKLMTPVRQPKLSLINSKSSEHVNSVLQTFTAPKNMNIMQRTTNPPVVQASIHPTRLQFPDDFQAIFLNFNNCY